MTAWLESRKCCWITMGDLGAIVCWVIWLYIEWYMYSSDELFQRSREGNFCVYFLSCEATREINTKITKNNTRVSAETVCDESTYIILFLTRHDVSINDHNDNCCTTIFPRSHLLGLRSADDVTIDCWWRHKKQTIVTRSREWWYLTR